MIREKMDALTGRLEELERLMSDPEVIRRQERYRALAREHAGLRDALARYGEYTRVERELEGSRRLLDDPASDEELKALAEGDVAALEERRRRLEGELLHFLLPRGKDDDRDTIVEIRAGTGG